MKNILTLFALVVFIYALPAAATWSCEGQPITREAAFNKIPTNSLIGIFARAHGYVRSRTCLKGICGNWSPVERLKYPSSRYEDELFFQRAADPSISLTLGTFNGFDFQCENVGEKNFHCRYADRDLTTAVLTDHCFYFMSHHFLPIDGGYFESQTWTIGDFR